MRLWEGDIRGRCSMRCVLHLLREERALPVRVVVERPLVAIQLQVGAAFLQGLRSRNQFAQLF
jgi:hypothetical protein